MYVVKAFDDQEQRPASIACSAEQEDLLADEVTVDRRRQGLFGYQTSRASSRTFWGS